MTGPIIPAELWPEWADKHCWDADGTGCFYGVKRLSAAWDVGSYVPSGIPMPAGHDWRVPVMRPTVKDSLTIAPVIDLEQFRGRFAEVLQAEFDLDVADPDDARHVDGLGEALRVADRLLALIDGQARGCDEAADVWGTQYPNKAIKLFGARELTELNWYPEEGAALVGLRVVERVQPGKGEGE